MDAPSDKAKPDLIYCTMFKKVKDGVDVLIIKISQ
jgi:hypothetical protein